jgi:hypothetical protein
MDLPERLSCPGSATMVAAEMRATPRSDRRPSMTARIISPVTARADAGIRLSMGFRGEWRGGGWSSCTQAPFPPLLLAHLDRVPLTRTIVALEQMSDGFVVN